MASNQKYVSFTPPFRVLVDHLAQDEDFVEELQSIGSLAQDQYLRLVAQLSKADGFLHQGAIEEITQEVLGEDAGSKALGALIQKLASLIYGAAIPADRAMGLLAHAIREKSTQIAATEREILGQRIRALAVEPPGIARQFKAQDLNDAISAELDDFRLVCDIRPIFDQKRERIEGAIPISILRLEYSQANGDGSGIAEMRLTAKQIGELHEAFSKAKQKLRIISDSLRSQKIPMPRTPGSGAD